MRTIIFALSVVASPSFAEIPGVMKDLVGLRGDLETLSRDAESAYKEQQAELDLWVQKKLELEAALQKETLRRLQLDEKIKYLSARVKTESRSEPSAKRELSAWLERAESWVNSSLPFRRENRLQSLSALKERLNRGMESLESLAAELWLFYETEFKMAADNEYRIVEIGAATGEQKAEVVRLGLFAMFARTPDGNVQRAVSENGEWRMQTVGEPHKSDVLRLLDNMKAKKKSGLYALPIPPPKEVL